MSPACRGSSLIEATVGVAPTHSGFADRRVATSPCGLLSQLTDVM